MIVSLKSNPTKIYGVYAVYWAEYRGVCQRHYYVIDPDDGLGGFTPLAESQVDLADPTLDHFFLCDDPRNRDMLVHRLAHPSQEFFYALVNHGDLEKVEELVASMRSRGLQP